MSSSAVVTSASPATASPAAEKKAKKVAKAKKPSSAPSHPPTQQMVDAAIKTLKERGGSSLPAIKKYLTSTYNVDAQKLAPFIKKYLKSAVTSGKLIQTKGKGASGSFKLSVAGDKKKATAAGDKKKKTASATKKPSAAKKKTEKPKAKPASYTAPERGILVTIYLTNNRSVTFAQREFRRRFPSRPTPTGETLRRLAARLEETGTTSVAADQLFSQ